jgi:hypothetical protein
MVGFASQVGFLVAASISPGMNFADQPQPPELRAASGGVTATPTAGTYCRSTRRESLCADSAYPLDVERLPVTPGAVITFTADERLTSLRTCLETRKMRFSHCRRAHGADYAWRMRLPRRLKRADRISIDVRFPGGDGNYELGLRIRCRSCGPQS